MAVKKFVVEGEGRYTNDTGPDDDYYHEFLELDDELQAAFLEQMKKIGEEPFSLIKVVKIRVRLEVTVSDRS